MKKQLFLVFFFLLFQGVSAQQESLTVTGKVVEADTGIPIPGANVFQKGTSNGVVTDFDGLYSIEVPADAILVFSYVGFTLQEVPVGGQSQFNISLKPEANALE